MRMQLRDRFRSDQRHRSAPVRPLGFNDLCLVADALAEVAPSWTVELSCAQPGDASLVVMPEGADDLLGPTFIIYRERNGFRLDQFQWDELSGLGEYVSLHDAVRAMLIRLRHVSAEASSCSLLRH